MTTALGAIYAVSGLVYCQHEAINLFLSEIQDFPSLRQFSTKYRMGLERMVWLTKTEQF